MSEHKDPTPVSIGSALSRQIAPTRSVLLRQTFLVLVVAICAVVERSGTRRQVADSTESSQQTWIAQHREQTQKVEADDENADMINMNLPTCRPIAIAACLILAVISSRAGPAAVVTIIKAKHVVIEDHQITIVAEARTGLMTINDKWSVAYDGFTYRGRPADRIKIYSDEATFTLRPIEGSGNQEEAWNYLVQTATRLESGEITGEIDYMDASVTIEQCLLKSIDGSGYLVRAVSEGNARPTASKPPPGVSVRGASATTDARTQAETPDGDGGH